MVDNRINSIIHRVIIIIIPFIFTSY